MASNACAGEGSEREPFSLVPKPKTTVQPRYCLEKGCKARLARINLDPHLLCVLHRGVDCNLIDRCDVCELWDNDSMKEYLNHQSKLERKRKSQKPGGSQGVSSVSEPPPLPVDSTAS